MVIIQKLKSHLLTKLFKEWVNDEYDLELLAMTKQLITLREDEIKTMIDTINHVEIKGFRIDG